MWFLKPEPLPPLCAHYMGDGHQLSSTCWCKPLIENRAEGTTVIHKDAREYPRLAG